MTRREVEEKVSTFIKRNYLFDENKSLDPKASFIGTGVLDSTGILEMISYLEEDFHVTFADDELTGENFDSVERVVAILMKKLQDNSASV